MSKLPEGIPLYTGKLCMNTMICPIARKGYQSYNAQKDRCSREKHTSYRWYGGKGIKVLYSSRDFVSWWVYENKKHKFNRPTTSRIDHDGNYCFGNVVVQEFAENNQEPNIKRNVHKSKIKLFIDGEESEVFDSLREACLKTNLSVNTILKLLSGKQNKPVFTQKEATFEYVNKRSSRNCGAKIKNAK